MREIRAFITGQFIRKSSKLAGVQGEGNAAYLCLVFDDSWTGYGKRIIWRNAQGLNPVSLILGSGQSVGGSTLEYRTLIPPEPLEYEGWCSFTVEGFGEKDGVSSVALTVSDRLEVKRGDRSESAEPTPSQALQLQREIDGIMSEVTEGCTRAEAASAKAAEHAASSEQNAASAKANADRAENADASAEVYGALSRSWAEGGTGVRAGEDEDNAKYWAGMAELAASPGVRSFNGRNGNVMPKVGDYTKSQVGLGNADNTSDMDKPVSRAVRGELDGKAPLSHSHSPSDVTEGTLGGSVSASVSASADIGRAQIRNIYAGTADMTPGVSNLPSGSIYLVYEEVR